MNRGSEVDALDWPDFLDWTRHVWEPGQHFSIVAPTGAGKSTFAVGLLDTRRYVLGLDPKGGDSTLAGSGYERLSRWPPPREVYKRIEDGHPYRCLVGPLVNTTEDLPKLKAVQSDALKGAFDQRHWTVYVDELQILADRRLMGLAGSVERLLISARDKYVSFVSSFQAPRWVPRAATDQATWVAVSYTRDVDIINRLAEILGRSKAELRGAMKALGESPYSWLVVGRNPREPYRVTRPAEVTRRDPSSSAA